MATYGVVIDAMDSIDIMTSKAVNTTSPERMGAVTGVDGEVDGAVRFGANNIGSTVSACFAPPVTAVSGTHWQVWSFWFRLDAEGTEPFDYPSIGLVGMSDSTALSTTNADAYLAYDSTQGLGVKYGSTTGSFDYPGVVFAFNTWYHIEFAQRFGNATTGDYTLYVNGSEVTSGVGDNDGEPWDYAIINGEGTSSGGKGIPAYDHVVCVMSDDATAPRLGMLKTARYVPTGTAQGQWAGSDGNSVDNHLLVDDLDPLSADYVTSTAGDNEVDRYTHAALPAGAVPYAVQPIVAANLDTPGTDDFGVVLESNGTSQVTARTLGSGDPAWVAGDVAFTDPDGGGAWTKAKVDATTFGVTS